MSKLAIPCITVRPPWAQLIAQGIKTVENRDYPLPQRFIGKPMAIHSGKNYEKTAAERIAGRIGQHIVVPKADECSQGIIAIAIFDGHIFDSQNPWYVGLYGWRIAKVAEIPLIPVAGKLGFWSHNIDDKLLGLLE